MTEIHAFDPDGTPSPGAQIALDSAVAAIPESILDPQVASFIGRSAGTATAAAMDQAYRRGFSVKEWGAKGDGTTDDTIAIQAAADAVASYGVDAVLYFPEGVYRTSETLILSCSLDASAATISYSGTGIAVDLGDSRASGRVTFRKSMRAPRVVLATKSGSGWAPGTTGIRLVNLNACDLYLPYVQNFATGILGYGYAQGTAYNSVTLGAMENNQVNMLLDADAAGWANQNVFIGGRFQHLSAEGSNVAGARHLQINKPTNPVNNNLFLNPSFEGNTPEFHLDMAGTANIILNGRYEVSGGARVRWRSAATQNQIMYGYQSVAIVETWESGAHPSNNLIAGQGGHTATGYPAVMEQTSGPAAAVEVLMGSGALVSKANPETAYAVRRSANDTRMKRPADQYDRILMDHVNGRVSFGVGTAAPPVGVGIAGPALRLDTITKTSAVSAGSAAALPSAPAGYMGVYVDGAVRYIPYY